MPKLTIFSYVFSAAVKSIEVALFSPKNLRVGADDTPVSRSVEISIDPIERIPSRTIDALSISS